MADCAGAGHRRLGVGTPSTILAANVLRDGIAAGSARIAHQSIIEFVAAATRGGAERLLDFADARRKAGEFMAQFPIVYPDAAVLRTALRGAAAFGLSWFDAHLRACAEEHGIPKLLSRISGMTGYTAR